MAVLFASELPRGMTEQRLMSLFPAAATPVSINLLVGPTGKKLHVALLTFASPQAMEQALLLNGTDLGRGRFLLLSLVQDGIKIPMYTLFRDLPPQAKPYHMTTHLNLHTQGNAVVAMPMIANKNKGFSFSYLSSMADFLSCLALDGTEFLGKTISVTPGLFQGGRGRRCSA